MARRRVRVRFKVGSNRAGYFGICFLFVVCFQIPSAYTKTYTSAIKAALDVTASASHRRLDDKVVDPKRKVYYNGTDYVVNHFYGWQPSYLPKPMNCSWKDCMEREHSCHKDCRDDPEDLEVSTTTNNNTSWFRDSVDEKNWVPDVTMLRRMFIDGHDANGNPWPPPLDDGLCNTFGDEDKSKYMMDAVPIITPAISKEESNTSRVFCMIYSTEGAHGKNIRAIRETWAPGCDGFLVFSTKSDPRIPAISVPHVGPEEYKNMWQKIRSMWQYVGKHFVDQFDWFYIGGDDLVVFPQNLKNYLATYNSSKPYYIGRRFKSGAQGYNTGGAGYALSRPALECFVKHLGDPVCWPFRKTSAEDALTGRCLQHACGIIYEDTRDAQLRERFHHWYPELLYFYRGERKWYNDYNQEWGLVTGKNCCVPETINFHYLKVPSHIRYIFHYVQNCHRNVSSSW